MSADIQPNLAIPPDFHPATLGSAQPGLKDAVSRTYLRWGEILAAGDELETRAKGARPAVPKRKLTEQDRARLDAWKRETSAYQAELARKAQPLVERALTTLSSALDSAKTARDRLDAEIKSAVVPRAVTGPYDVEIRAALKARGDALTSVMTAIEADQRDVVAAALGAPPMLTGLTDAQRDALVAAARKKFCPEQCRELEALDADIERVGRMHDRFMGDMQRAVSSWRSDEQAIIDGLGA